MTEATPRPWYASRWMVYREAQGEHVHAEAVARTDVGIGCHDEQEANAELIARAVNAHDDLVGILTHGEWMYDCPCCGMVGNQGEYEKTDDHTCTGCGETYFRISLRVDFKEAQAAIERAEGSQS